MSTGAPTREYVKILLSEAASAALLAAGDCFMIAGRGSYPEADGKRVVIHCLPVPKTLADAACRVAMGTHRAVKIKSPYASTTRARARATEPGLLAVPKKEGEEEPK